MKSFGQLLVHPSVAFPGPPKAGRALLFAALCGIGIGILLCGMAGVLLLDPKSYVRVRLEESQITFAAAMILALLLPSVVILLWTMAQALSFSAGLASAGRRAGVFRVALRACSYAQAMLLLCILFPFAGAVAAELAPSDRGVFITVRVLWIAATSLWLVLTSRLCFWAGRSLGLSSERAAFAAFGPGMLCLLVAGYLIHEQLTMLEAPQLYLR